MKAQEIINEVLSGGVKLIRPRKEEHVKGTPYEYDCKEAFTGSKKGWIYVDSFTASAMKRVFNALSIENQAKYNNIHFQRLVDFTWKSTK